MRSIFDWGKEVLEDPATAFTPSYCLELGFYRPGTGQWIAFKRTESYLMICDGNRAKMWYFAEWPEVEAIKLINIHNHPSTVLEYLEKLDAADSSPARAQLKAIYSERLKI